MKLYIQMFEQLDYVLKEMTVLHIIIVKLNLTFIQKLLDHVHNMSTIFFKGFKVQVLALFANQIKIKICNI